MNSARNRCPAPAGRATERPAVHQQLHLVGIGVDLDDDWRALVALPAPARDDIAPRPRARVHDGLAVVLGPLHGEVGIGAAAEDDLAVVRLRKAVTGDVDVGAPGGSPRVVAAERRHAERVRLLSVLDAADPRLAEVVPPGPGEVADDVGVREHAGPVGVDGRRVGLGRDDHPLREELAVELEPGGHVVVPGDVEVRERLTRLVGDDGRPHRRAHEVRQVHGCGVDSGVLVGSGRGCGVADIVEQFGSADEQARHCLRDEASVVERSHLLGQRASEV